MKKMRYTLLTVLLTFFACSAPDPVIVEGAADEDVQYAIAYNVLFDAENGDYEVFTMNTDGTDKQNVTNFPGVEWTYLSVRDVLYYISDKDTSRRCFFLYSSDSQGKKHRQISQYRLADSWMSSRKNGTELIVKPHVSLDSAFYIIDLKGKLVQRVATGLPSSSDPLFIGDGRRIAFRGGSKKSKREPGYREEIYLMNVDGSGLTQLTHYPESDTTAPWYAYKAGPPRYHPTENFISYASFQEGKYSLFGVAPDGKKQWKLTQNDRWEVYHDWSPDGKWLAVDLCNADQTHYDVGLMSWPGKELKILTDTTYQYQQSPNFLVRK